MKKLKTISLILPTLLLSLTGCFKPQTLAQKMEPKQEAGHSENYYLGANPFVYFFAVDTNKELIYEMKSNRQNLAFAASQSRPSLSISDQIVNELIYNALFSRSTYSQLAEPHVSFAKTSNANHLQAMLSAEQYLTNSPLKDHECVIVGVYDNDYKLAYTFTVQESHSYRRLLCKKADSEVIVEILSRPLGNSQSHTMIVMRADFKNGKPHEEYTYANLKYEFFDVISPKFDNSWHKMGLGFRKTDDGFEWANKSINNGVIQYIEVTPYPGSNHSTLLNERKKHL